jgi:hypothetical protein
MQATSRQDTSQELDRLCYAMFIAGAQALGLDRHDELPPQAREKILIAAEMLVKRLRLIHKMLTNPGPEREPRK